MILYNIFISFLCNKLLDCNKYVNYNYKNERKGNMRIFSRNYLTIKDTNESENNLLKNISDSVSNSVNNSVIYSNNEISSYHNFINFAKANNITNSKYKDIINYEGYDMRYDMKYNNTDDAYTMIKIGELFLKKKLLDILLDNKTCENYKINYINEYNILNNNYTCNLNSGGLFDDWNYSI